MEIYTTRYIPCSYLFINLIIILRINLLIKRDPCTQHTPLVN